MTAIEEIFEREYLVDSTAPFLSFVETGLVIVLDCDSEYEALPLMASTLDFGGHPGDIENELKGMLVHRDHLNALIEAAKAHMANRDMKDARAAARISKLEGQ
jgi:hypothetical protein